MIAHISIGVRDINRSRAFYDAALPPLGYKCMRAARSMVGYGYGADSISLWVYAAEHPVPADEKSGLHFCFEAPNAAAVDAFHAAALRAGGKDDGAPGVWPRLLCRLHYRSGRIPHRSLLRPWGKVRLI